jgi:hypothetical protein
VGCKKAVKQVIGYKKKLIWRRKFQLIRIPIYKDLGKGRQKDEVKFDENE